MTDKDRDKRIAKQFTTEHHTPHVTQYKVNRESNKHCRELKKRHEKLPLHISCIKTKIMLIRYVYANKVHVLNFA